VEIPYLRNPALIGINHIRIRPTSDDVCEAVAVVEKIGKLEAMKYNKPYPIGECEQEGDIAEGDGDESGESLDDGGSLASFRDPGEDCRGDGERHDKNTSRSVDDVPQGTAIQAERRDRNQDDHGCSGYSTLENKGHSCRAEH